jgi:hypothetical protein
MLRVIYRTCNTENKKTRPPYYSKIGCLKNFILVYRKVRKAGFYLVSDGEPPKKVRELVEPFGRIEVLSRPGNSSSFLLALEMTRNFESQDMVYFVEDDYLHVPEALLKLLEVGIPGQGDSDFEVIPIKIPKLI